jgi:hypothetical protein
MYSTKPLDSKLIDRIAGSCTRNQLQYHEYSFLTKDMLSAYFVSKSNRTIGSENSPGIVVFSEGELAGTIQCVKDDFDSECFDFPCYRITELLVFSEEYVAVKQIISKLLASLEEELASISKPFYLTYGLNNNTQNVDQIFNSFVSNSFYYVHTLLTFHTLKTKFETEPLPTDTNLIIRKATADDANQVAALAQKSFRLSRFHLDPFLDNTKASNLLKKSAENSILHGFVDVMFVAEINNRIIGYYSAKKRHIKEFEKTIGDAVISAVDFDFRGHGVFSKLDDRILNWFADHSDFAEMGTYLCNYPVHKTWINKGLGLIRGTHQFSRFYS